MTRARRSAGFTVLELVIAMALLALALLLATQILLESQRLLLRAQRPLVAEQDDFAVARLRSDLRSAAFARLPLTASAGVWQSGDLSLRFAAAGEVSWSLDGGALRRRELDADGDVTAERTMLQQADVWRWRALSSSLIEVELGARTDDAPRGSALLLERERRRSTLRTTSLRVFLRGRGGRQRW